MKRSSYILFLLVCLHSITLAQSEKIPVADSLAFSEMTVQFNAVIMEHPEQAVAISKEYYSKSLQYNNSLNKGKAAAMLSTAYFETDSTSQGEMWYNKAQQYFTEVNNYLWKGYANLNSGTILSQKYDFEKGLPYYLKSVDDFEKAKDFKMQVTVYNAISLAYHDFGKYDKGVEYAFAAKKVLDEHPEATNKNGYWYVYNNLGINYDDDKQYDKAIAAHLQALPYAENGSDSSYSYNNLGNTSKKLNKIDDAENYFRLAFQSNDDYSDTYHFATIYSNVVDVERMKKNYSLAHYYLDTALYYATKSESPEKLMDIYYYAYRLKNETGAYQAASEYLNKYVNLKDSLFTKEKNEAVLHYQAKYETEKKEKALAEAELTLAKETVASRQKSIALLLLGSVVVIGLIVFRNFRVKSRLKQEQLVLENKLLEEQTRIKIQEQRLEISRELHDNIGSQLTFINAVLDSFKTSPVKSKEEIEKKLKTLSEFSEYSVLELKNAIWALNAKELSLSELKLKMLNFIKNAAESFEEIQFHFNFDIVNNHQLTSPQALNLFRMFQEIVNNAIKHSNAKDITIDIKQASDALLMQISDNGKGLDLDERKYTSFGMDNIRNRVAALKGELKITAKDGKGTTYLITTNL